MDPSWSALGRIITFRIDIKTIIIMKVGGLCNILHRVASFIMYMSFTSSLREKNSNHWRKVNRYMSMIQVVFSIGIEAGGTKCVATSILIVSFSPDVLHRRPVQAVHLLVESLYFCSQPYLQTKHMFFSYFLMHAHDFIQRRDGRE